MNVALEAMSLTTPRGRVTLFSTLSLAVIAVPYRWIEYAHLSLYERLHIPAPTIGLTRSYWKLLHGDWQGAWQRNKLIYLVAPLLLAILIADIICLIIKRPTKLDRFI